MSIQFWDLLITGILVLVIIMFLTGNGQRAMELFGKDRSREMFREYDEKKLTRGTVIFCLVLLADEIVILFGDRIPYNTGLITLTVSLLAIILYVFYLRKYCRK